MSEQSKILIVEDSPVQAEALRHLLAKNGYQVMVAKNGSEGMEAIKRNKPALVISDIMMPVMDGYEMCKRIKENDTLKDVPLLLLTQLIEPDEVIRGLESGADNYLTKPFNEAFLLSKVKALLDSPDAFKNRPDRKSIEFEYDGKRYEVHSGRAQTLSYLISTYENAVLKTKELERAEEELRTLNEHLEEKVKERTAELKKTNDELKTEIVQRKKAEEIIRYMAYFDPLTDLPNKAGFDQSISNTLEECRVNKRSFALLVMGMNRFREINEGLGFKQGNELLKIIGMRLKGLLKDKETLAHWGANKFAVLMPGADSEYATSFAEEIVKTLDEPLELSGLKIYVHTSIGIALSPGHGNEADLLLRRAEVAMHQAKKVGNSYSVYTGEYERDISRRLSLAGDLRHALENGGLLLYCQPKVDMMSGRITGVEALLRWNHPKYGMISPNEFIPIAEYTGLIKPLTYWVLEASARQCFAWQEEKIEESLAVNLSVRNLHDPRLLDRINSLIRTWGIRTGGLEVELTESAFTDEPAVYETLTHLRNMGINIFIDDFGTGYSSLSYLQRLPVNAVKIDKSFVSNMVNDRHSASIVTSTIGLAHNMNLKVVAEGVESRETYDMLCERGCNEAQGYYVSKPMPAEEFSNWRKKYSWKLAG